MRTSKMCAIAAAMAVAGWIQGTGAAAPVVDVGAQPGSTAAVAKDYDRAGKLRIAGGANFSISNPNTTVTLTLGGISNDDPAVASGAIRVRLFLTTESPLGFGYTKIAETSFNALPPGSSYPAFTQTLPLLTAANDVYYVYVGVFEQEASCASPDGFCLDDRYSFAKRIKVLTGVYTEEPPIPGSANAVEYYNTPFDHYFFTDNPDEISKLDGGVFQGWARSGRTFNVWGNDVGGTFGVCRFFSTSFGLKSSHFYTPLAEECTTVKANPDWQYEGIVAYVDLPAGDGSCVEGVPLYRLYNDGMGGAPNHRYTTSYATRAHMITTGWISEGYGAQGVIACIPY